MPDQNDQQPDAARPDQASELRHGLLRNHADMVAAVHQVLNAAGISGVEVSSLRFRPQAGGLSCNLPCPPNQHCEFDSNGGEVTPVCVPD